MHISLSYYEKTARNPDEIFKICLVLCIFALYTILTSYCRYVILDRIGKMGIKMNQRERDMMHSQSVQEDFDRMIRENFRN